MGDRGRRVRAGRAGERDAARELRDLFIAAAAGEAFGNIRDVCLRPRIPDSLLRNAGWRFSSHLKRGDNILAVCGSSSPGPIWCAWILTSSGIGYNAPYPAFWSFETFDAAAALRTKDLEHTFTIRTMDYALERIAKDATGPWEREVRELLGGAPATSGPAPNRESL